MKNKSMLCLVILFSLVTFSVIAAGSKSDAAADEKTSSKDADANITFPLDQKITLTVFSDLGFKIATVLKNHAEMECYKLLEEKTNVKFVFTHPPVGEFNNQLNLMIAAQDLPDIIEGVSWSTRPGGPEKAIADKTIVDIAPYVDQYAPNFKKMIKSDDVYLRAVYTDSGALPGFFTLWGVKMRVNLGLMIRNDWLKKINKGVPTTLEEWYDVMKLFSQNDMNGNGDPTDEIPFSTHRLWQDEQAFMYAYDLAPDNNGFFAQDGKVKYSFGEPAYKDFLIYMKKWYDEKLLDPEFTSTNRKIFDAKMMSDQVGACFGGAGMGFSGYFYKSKAEAGDMEFELVGAPAVRSVTGRKIPFGHQANPVGGATSITPKNKYIRETIAVIDYGYSPDGTLMMLYGSPGVVYNLVDGKIQYTEYATNNPDGLTFDQVLCKHGLASQSGGPAYHHGDFWEMSVSFRDQTKEMLAIWADVDTSYKMNYVTNTQEEVQQISSIVNDIVTYADEMYVRFIIGSEPIANFDNYIKKLNDYGLQKVLSIQQDAYERYLKR